VSGCRTHADEIGPYVLGALEPDEMEAMRRHLAGCSRCAAEVESLTGIPVLLDRAGAYAEIAPLAPGLEDEVLDRFVRERAASRPQRRRWPRLAIPAIAVAALIAGILIAVLPSGSGTDTAYAKADLWSLPAGGGAGGSAEASEVAAGTRVKLRAHDLPVGQGKAYELWCVRTDGRWVDGGTFRARSDGTAAAELTAPVRPGDYHVVVITRRSRGDLRGAEVMRGKLVY
jgi:Anti-sigma-K factor rskA, C-terminal/Putative zinc-finger